MNPGWYGDPDDLGQLDNNVPGGQRQSHATHHFASDFPGDAFLASGEPQNLWFSSALQRHSREASEAKTKMKMNSKGGAEVGRASLESITTMLALINREIDRLYDL